MYYSNIEKELDELYDQFSHWLEDPNGAESGQNGRNAAVFRFAHGLLKRALSDSFASVALNIENLSSQPETRMKDIKLSASSESRRGSTQRSWSLAEHVGDERLALQLAKEMVEREVPEEQVLPMPDIVPLVPVPMEEEEPTPIKEPEPERIDKEKSNKKNNGNSSSSNNNNRNKPPCPLVSIVLEQKLADLELQVPAPCSRRAVRSPAPNNNSRCAAGMRTQESVAWEYHQNPYCAFNIRLDSTRHRPVDIASESVVDSTATATATTITDTRASTSSTITTTTTTSLPTPPPHPPIISTNPSPPIGAAKVSSARAHY